MPGWSRLKDKGGVVALFVSIHRVNYNSYWQNPCKILMKNMLFNLNAKNPSLETSCIINWVNQESIIRESNYHRRTMPVIVLEVHWLFPLSLIGCCYCNAWSVSVFPTTDMFFSFSSISLSNKLQFTQQWQQFYEQASGVRS